MKHTTRLLVIAAGLVGVAGMAATGWAYWSAGGSGSASATVGTLNPPTNVTATATFGSGTVPVSWTASTTTAPPAVTPTGYYVERFDGEAPTTVCGSPSSPLTTTSCDDTDVDDGTYTYRVTAVFASWTAVSAPSASVTVSNIGPAAQIVLSGSAADLAAGTTRVLTATIQDAAGHTITTGSDSSHSITFGQTAGTGSVSGLGTVNASNGVATISVTGNLAGPVTTQASATFAGGAVTSNDLGFDVVHGTASELSLSGATSDLASGAPRVLTATVKDAAGNTVTTGSDATRSITFTQTGGSGSLGGIAGGISATAGVANITVTGYGAGPVTTQASTTLAAGLAQSNTLSINVTVGAATKLAFTDQPGNSTGGIPLSTQPKVIVQDFGGNTVTTDIGSVTLAIGTNPAGGTLSGTVTVDAVNGLATFSGLSIDKAGNGYTLTASRSGLSTGTSAAFDITVGPAAKLSFTTAPSHATVGSAFGTQPRVTIQDAGGNTVTTDSATVALAITAGTPVTGGPGTLSGCTQMATAGVVGFAGCKIDTLGTGYKLHANAGSLTAADSATFDVYGNVAGLVFSNVKVNGTSVTPICTGTVGSTYTCNTTGGNNSTVNANVVFASASGTATAYSSQNRSIGWSATGKGTPNSGTLTITGNQTTSGTTASAQMNGANSAAITVTFTSWNGQTWTAVLNVSR